MGHELISVGNYEFNPGMTKKFIAFPMGTSGTELSEFFYVQLYYSNIILLMVYLLTKRCEFSVLREYPARYRL
jgi:hypothetical protein